jgi:hypothetical protein
MRRRISLGLAGLGLMAACTEGTMPYVQSPNTVIAAARDGGDDSGGLANGRAAIVYDPDGCQNWIIDDGTEGYATPRFDPETGLPVCDHKYPPGTVIGDYERGGGDFPDYVPLPGPSNGI